MKLLRDLKNFKRLTFFTVFDCVELNMHVYLFVCWFVCILWHFFRLFNAESIFIQKTVLFQIIQFSISSQFNCQKHFYFKLFSFA